MEKKGQIEQTYWIKMKRDQGNNDQISIYHRDKYDKLHRNHQQINKNLEK